MEGCDNWPSVGYTGVCCECIKDPKKVEKAANQMAKNVAACTKIEREDHILVCWLSREPQKCLEMVLEVVRSGETDVRKAMDVACLQYWRTINTVKP